MKYGPIGITNAELAPVKEMFQFSKGVKPYQSTQYLRAVLLSIFVNLKLSSILQQIKLSEIEVSNGNFQGTGNFQHQFYSCRLEGGFSEIRSHSYIHLFSQEYVRSYMSTDSYCWLLDAYTYTVCMQFKHIQLNAYTNEMFSQPAVRFDPVLVKPERPHISKPCVHAGSVCLSLHFVQ